MKFPVKSRMVLLVAESGGHLEQLTRLEPRLRPPVGEAIYVTSSTAQSRSLLAGRSVRYVPNVPPRGWRPALRALGPAYHVMRELGITEVVSTGSAIAVPYLATARLLGLQAHYIESAARTSGPSLSGKLLEQLPGINLYAQHPYWANGRWCYEGSVFDGFSATEDAVPVRPARRVVITLGTIPGYSFRRAVDAVLRVLPEVTVPNPQVLWQVGDCPVDPGLPGTVLRAVPAAKLRAAIDVADLVVAHAGIGSSLQILDSGRVPVLLPRSLQRREHVDDHQRLIAEELHQRGLAVSVDPDHLDAGHMTSAMQRRVERDPDSAAFNLRSSLPPRRQPGRLSGPTGGNLG